MNNGYEESIGNMLFSTWMGYVDRDGKPVTRTKITHPYSYATFVLWRSNKPVTLESSDSCDSDRMYTWNYKRHDNCCKEVWNNEGQYFDQRSPESIQKFLRLYFRNDTIVLNMIEEWCNQSSGYPGWHFSYTYNGKLASVKDATR